MAKLTKNYNLEVILPDLALEWHPTKNGILRPSDFTPSWNKKVWWICKNGHEWHVPIILRKKGQGCPYCSGQRVCIDNCLQTKFPEIAKQWHPEKNNVLSPLNVTSGTGIKVWWRCDQNHEWEAAISNRTSGRGCPVCNKFRATKENCLQNVNPVVSKEWHPIKNGNLKPKDVASNSRRKIWWICNKGHIWKAAVYSRNKGHGCPYCTGQKVCIDNCLMKINPKLAQSWHCTKNKPLTPFKVTSKSNKKVWWVCDQGHEWEATINSQSYGGGCPTCKGLKRYK
jgi:hypothetical protein